MRKIINFFFVISKSVVLVFLMFALSVVLLSFSLRGEKNINPYCKLDKNIDVNIEIEGIKNIEYVIDCSTIYFSIILEDFIDKNEAISILYDIGNKVKKYECFIHFEVSGRNFNKPIYATYNYQNNLINFVGSKVN